MNSDIKLAIAALIPVAASGLFYFFENRTAFGKQRWIIRQIIIGIVFGGIAIIGTEWGIPVDGAMVNCRDAAPLCAGLFFGGPAGMIAGLIGGVERWIAVAWGVGSFTRVACSVSTVIAGIYAALLRRYMFRDKRPGWALALASGVAIESFHLTMVFVTNLNNAEKAAAVVKACSNHMIIANGLSVMLAAILITLLAKENLSFEHEHVSVEKSIQRWLLLCILVAFCLTSVFLYFFQNGMAKQTTANELDYCVLDVAADIEYSANAQILKVTGEISRDASPGNLGAVKDLYNVDEINLIGKDGIIFASTNPDYIGFDMRSGEQSAAFMCLLNDQLRYAQPLMNISYDDTTSRKYAGVKTAYGFVQVGYTAYRYQQSLNEKVADITRYRHVGETGVVFIVGSDGVIFSGPAEYIGKDLSASPLLDDIAANPEHSVFRTAILGEDSIASYAKSEGFTIVAYMLHSEAYGDRDTALYINTFLEIMVFAVLFAFIDALIRKLVTSRIQKVNGSLQKITAGDLNEVVNVRGNEEFAQLSDDINSTVDTLKDYIDQAERRIEDELNFAKNIQASALPSIFPAFPKRHDFDIYASMDPAKEVGGDFYDFYLTSFDGTDTLNFLNADVSGKGIPAAMFMMKAKTMLKNLTESGLSLPEVFARANNGLCEGNDEVGMFVTALQGTLNLDDGTLKLVNAGHNPPAIKHAGGSFEFVKLKPCLVLAGMEGVPYRETEIKLEKGDTVFLYTDGVTEATDANNQLYGDERLLAALNLAGDCSMEELCRLVRADIDHFVGSADQFDDITMTAVNYRGSMERRELNFAEATVDDIPEVTDFIEEALDEMGCPMQMKLKVDIIIDEIFSNICRYAYDGNPGVAAVIVEETQDPHGVKLIFADRGKPYNPLEKEDPDVGMALEDRTEGGLGIYMVKKSVDEINYVYTNNRNILTLKTYF